MSDSARRALLRGASLAPILAAALSSCAGLDDDIALAPLVTHVSTAGGADQWEALGGALRLERARPDGPVTQWDVHPIACWEAREGRDSLARFVVPLGKREVRGEETVTQLLPIFRLQTEPDELGGTRHYWISLPAILWAEDSTDRVFRGVFPLGGTWEKFATYDRVDFALFPLYMRTQREGGTFHHFLWPLFSYGHNGRGELDFHLWPLYGVAKPGNSESRFVLWPFFTWKRSRLQFPPEKQIETWMLWPFYGRERGETFVAHSFLWPFFGYSSDSKSGYWSWDGPWPLVRFTRPGESGEAYRSRVWPLYSYFEGDGLASRWILWPLFNQREEIYKDGRRDGENLIPFWQHFRDTDLAGEARGSWSKLWPIFQLREDGVRSRFGLLSPLPTWNLPDLDEHYAWMWELYSREANGPVVHERSWLGLWRRETDPAEQRDYLSGLWSRRKYRDRGHSVREHSLLFGLVRWRRTRAEGFELLRPAFPGPGWPSRPNEAP